MWDMIIEQNPRTVMIKSFEIGIIILVLISGSFNQQVRWVMEYVLGQGLFGWMYFLFCTNLFAGIYGLLQRFLMEEKV